MAPKKQGSKALVKWDEKKFAQYAKEGKEQMKNVASGGVGVKFGPGRISIGGADVPGAKLEAIILGYCAMNAWNKDAYDADNPQPPDCYAFSAIYGAEDMAPHEKAPLKQSPDCASCEKNEFGSAATGKGKACANTVRMALLTGDDVEDDETAASAELATAKVSATNVKHFKAYVDSVATEHGRPIWAVVTEISSHSDPKTQIRLEFKMVALIDNPGILEALEKRQEGVQEIVQAPFQPAAERPAKGKAGATKKFAGKVSGRR